MRILLADDSVTAQNMGKKILVDAGYEVVAVSNGAAAVKKIAETKPDLAVLDVNMPGYTGLEVCERIRKARETASMPVLLAIGKLEHLEPQAATKVKANGVIIKPYESSDLLSAVQRYAQQLYPATAVVQAIPAGNEQDVPEYEKTQKISVPFSIEKTQKIAIPFPTDFKDASYEQWKETAEVHVDPQEAPPAAEPAKPVGSDSSKLRALTAAMGIGELEAGSTTPEAPAHKPTVFIHPPTAVINPSDELAQVQAAIREPALPPMEAAAPAAVEESPAVSEPEPAPAPAAESIPDTVPIEPPPAPEAEPEAAAEPVAAASEQPEDYPPTQKIDMEQELEPTAAAPVELATPMYDPNLEATAAAPVEVDPAAPSGFEPTSAPAVEEHVSHAGQDPALVTDVAEMSAAFPTRFGVEGAEPIAVGVASDLPPEVFQAPSAEPAAPPAPGWRAEETHLEDHEHGVSLHEEMQRAFAAAASGVASSEPEPAPPASEPPPAAAVVATPENVRDPHLAAAMAAAMGGDIAPAVAAAMSAATGKESTPDQAALIAEVVQRVTESMKPELIARIAKEVAAEMEKKKNT